MTIYEIRDVSDDERYYPVGLFATLAEAIAAIEAQAEPWDLSDQADNTECVSLEIRERRLGLAPLYAGKAVWKRAWNYVLNEDENESHWAIVPQKEALK